MTELQLNHPVIGYRIWRSRGQGRLLSLAHEFHWEKGTNTAICLRNDNPHEGQVVPVEDCGCGLYGWHSPETVPAGFLDYRRVMGLVRGWGEVRVHKEGWRSQFAEVVAIIEQGASIDRRHAREAAEYYDVPLLHENAMPGALQEFGELVPEEVRPQEPLLAIERRVPYHFITCDDDSHVVPSIPLMLAVGVWKPLRDRMRQWLRRVFLT